MSKRFTIILSAFAATLALSAQKLSPNAEALLLHRALHGPQSAAPMKSIAQDGPEMPERVRAFVTFDDESSLDSLNYFGGRVYQTFGHCATAEVPVDRLRDFSNLGGIRYVEMGNPVHLCNDIVRNLSGINAIHSGSGANLGSGYTGKDIVVGIIDTGLDYNHIAFRNPDGSLRIKRVWNQNANGRAPEAFGYGSELVAEGEIKAAATDTRGEYHGTHTTNIAAGGDLSSEYYGMAPESDIVFVSFGQNSVDIPNAVKYIFDYAESVGKPCVINMSLGSHIGPHNGQSTLDRYFESAAAPGRLLVGAVGNEGASNMHIGTTFTESTTQLKTILKIPSGPKKETALDIWGTEGADYEVRIILTDAKGRIVEQSEPFAPSSEQPLDFSFKDANVDAYFYLVGNQSYNGNDPNVYVECYINSVGDTRNIGFAITGKEGTTVNAWNLGMYDFVSGGFRGFSAGDNAMTAGEIGGTGDAVISVGSYNSRFSFPLWVDNDPDRLYTIDGFGPEDIPLGEVSDFSSRGPTVDGRMKPDVLAPGALVVSAMNGYTDQAQQYGDQMVGRTVDGAGKAHYYYVNVGTSMASPVVAGSLALWLEADPTLTTEKVRDIIARTSKLDQGTGETPDNNAGYGKFNALDGLNLVLSDPTGAAAATDTPAAQRAWYADGKICVASPAQEDVTLCAATGATVGHYRLAPGLHTVDAPASAPGVYVLRFDRTGRTVKIAIR